MCSCRLSLHCVVIFMYKNEMAMIGLCGRAVHKMSQKIFYESIRAEYIRPTNAKSQSSEYIDR